jgi:UDP-N-acetyl-D-mannosaminuronate dehydrogenase
MKHLIIGAGEVGTAIHEVLSKKFDVTIRDKEDLTGQFDVLHITIPYSKDFIKECKRYFSQYKPKFAIIHSTVKPGTTKKLGKNYVYSPIRGKHPKLITGIITFTKYFGGTNSKNLYDAWEIFKTLGIEGVVSTDPTEVELLKILETTYYGWNIVFMKEVHKLCKKYNADFSLVYKHANETYNQGYARLENYQYVRPVLEPIPGPIGGHCVINNCHLLKSDITKTILKHNKTYV